MFKCLRSCMVVGLLAIGSSAVAQVSNPTTAMPYQEKSLAPVPARTAAVNVLWDVTHGVAFGYEPAGAFSNLVASLPGYNFTTTNAGIDNIDLSQYDILVICVGSSWNSAYTASEVVAAQAFASAGGAILILGDNSQSFPENINPVAQAFGVTTGIDTLFPLDLYFSNWTPDVIFAGISQLYFRAGGGLAVVAPSTPFAWTDDETSVTIALSMGPCVVTIGDVNMFAEYLAYADNQAFAANVFSWLSTGCISLSVEPTSWGKVKAIYK